MASAPGAITTLYSGAASRVGYVLAYRFYLSDSMTSTPFVMTGRHCCQSIVKTGPGFVVIAGACQSPGKSSNGYGYFFPYAPHLDRALRGESFSDSF